MGFFDTGTRTYAGENRKIMARNRVQIRRQILLGVSNQEMAAITRLLQRSTPQTLRLRPGRGSSESDVLLLRIHAISERRTD